MLNPVLASVLQFVESLGLQTLEDLRISSLNLTIAPWIGHRGKTHLDAHVFAEVEEGPTGELGAIIHDDPIGHSETEHDPLDELDGGLGRLSWYWHHLHPLGELVDCHEKILMSPDGLRDLAYYVQPPDRERPRDRNRLQGLCWLMNIFRIMLASFTCLDDLLGVVENCWPVEHVSKDLPRQRP